LRDKLQPESSFVNWLQNFWTPVFTGVTTFYEAIKNEAQKIYYGYLRFYKN